MKNFISYDDVNILCGRRRCNNEERTFSDKSERENGRWSSFKAKVKNVWGKIKQVACIVTTGLTIAGTLLKAFRGAHKEYRKMKAEFA